MEMLKNKKKVLEVLNRILEHELAGVVRYTHYSLMIYGYNRIPIVGWLRGEAGMALVHAQKAGEMITTLGEHPSLAIGPLLETHKHDVQPILLEALETEKQGLALYRELLKQAVGESVYLEEYARDMIVAEEDHLSEVDKMLRKPGEIHNFAGGK
jgi:bacterioferritin